MVEGPGVAGAARGPAAETRLEPVAASGQPGGCRRCSSRVGVTVSKGTPWTGGRRSRCGPSPASRGGYRRAGRSSGVWVVPATEGGVDGPAKPRVGGDLEQVVDGARGGRPGEGRTHHDVERAVAGAVRVGARRGRDGDRHRGVPVWVDRSRGAGDRQGVLPATAAPVLPRVRTLVPGGVTGLTEKPVVGAGRVACDGERHRADEAVDRTAR